MGSMPEADPLALIRRLYDEVWNQGDMAAADAILSPAFEGGREAFKASVRAARQTTGIHHTILDLRAEADEVVTRVQAQSRVNGARRTMDGVVRWRVADGQVVGREAHWWPAADTTATDDPAAVAGAVTTAEQLLERRLGSAVRLTDATMLRYPGWRNLLIRCRVADGPPSLPATLIVKQPREGQYDPATPTSPAHEVLTEWAALATLNELPLTRPTAPRFYGGERESGVLVMEDLGRGGTLGDTLAQSDAVAAEQGLRRFAKTVGRLHATTVGRTGFYEHQRERLGPRRPTILARLPEAAGRMRTVLGRIDVAPSERFEAEIAGVVHRLEQPGPFHALTHGDCCPVNGIAIDGVVWLVDFEFAGVGHALRDVVWWHMHFTANGGAGRLPTATLARMDAAYREEVAAVCPAARDDTAFAAGLADAAAAWTLLSYAGAPPVPLAPLLEADRAWGSATARQRMLVRLAVFEELAEHGELPELQRVAEQVSRALRACWPELAQGELPHYPAFGAGAYDRPASQEHV